MKLFMVLDQKKLNQAKAMCEKAKNINELIDNVSNLSKLKFNKFNEEYEYEIKFDITGNDSIKSINASVSDFLEQSNYYVFRCEIDNDYAVDFFTYGEQEYSVFICDGKHTIKKKHHEIIYHNGMQIMKSSEEIKFGKKSIKEIIDTIDVKYVGKMYKTRRKNFIINTEINMVFTSVTTCCAVNDFLQVQHEIEYYGHYVDENENIISEVEILQELCNIANLLIRGEKLLFSISTKTKFDFVKENILNQ